MNANDDKAVQANCPLGTFATGGGYNVTDNSFPPQIKVSVMENMDATAAGAVSPGWSVYVAEAEPTDIPWKVTAWVSCAG